MSGQKGYIATSYHYDSNKTSSNEISEIITKEELLKSDLREKYEEKVLTDSISVVMSQIKHFLSWVESLLNIPKIGGMEKT